MKDTEWMEYSSKQHENWISRYFIAVCRVNVETFRPYYISKGGAKGRLFKGIRSNWRVLKLWAGEKHFIPLNNAINVIRETFR